MTDPCPSCFQLQVAQKIPMCCQLCVLRENSIKFIKNGFLNMLSLLNFLTVTHPMEEELGRRDEAF